MFLEDGDKLYLIEDNKVVAAMNKDAYYGSCPRTECEHHGVTRYDLGKGSRCKGCGTSMNITFPKKDEGDKEVEARLVFDSLTFGDRVSYKHKTGAVISMVDSIYGATIGVKFDDGEIGEYLFDELTKLQSKEAANSAGVEGILSAYDEYKEMVDYTADEIAAKEKIARSLNNKAKALLTDRKLSHSERVKLDSIVVTTAVDVLDLKDRKISSHQEYMDSLPKYSMSETFNNWGSLARVRTNEDISWVQNLEADVVDWDAKLSALATEMTEALTLEQLTDEDFMVQAKNYRTASFNEDQVKRLDYFLTQAVEFKKSSFVKEASVEPDDTDFQAVFI